VVTEIDDGDVTDYFVVPDGITGTSGGAGVAVHPVTGHTWLGGAILGGTNRLAEFSEDGVLLRQLNVLDAAGGATVSVRRIAFDASGERLFMVTFGAEVYELGVPPPVPGISVWGGIAAGLAMALGARLRRRAA
jgi:hypothetical protein